MNLKLDYHLKLNIPKNGARGVQADSFYCRKVKAWNDLSKTITHTKNINIFKTNLDDVLKDLQAELFKESQVCLRVCIF